MKKRFLTSVILAAGLGLASVSALAAQTLVPAQSKIGFAFKQMNVPVEGSFKRFDANVNFDLAKPEKTQATINVDLTSIDVGSADGNKTTQGKDWFNTTATPKATFVASSVKALGGGKFEARGKLTIKGVSKDIVAQLTAKQDGANLDVEGSFPMMRLQYKIGDGEWADTGTVADEVTVKFKLVLAGKPN
ncbi:polyisoprenoid-binding protein YceI [Silvimonas terrae]|uniref:Polyisoprenoid-binding protein YceI n=1 Tax=Silvimonas terrae TaxID=300266 RepID=A0A840RIG7_9NEIS|nr:YceI family protein [Silvimonas terrae]MBB5192897.1 polyisoprenoid-binding protein YceI [Silvimonas terrae]